MEINQHDELEQYYELVGKVFAFLDPNNIMCQQVHSFLRNLLLLLYDLFFSFCYMCFSIFRLDNCVYSLYVQAAVDSE